MHPDVCDVKNKVANLAWASVTGRRLARAQYPGIAARYAFALSALGCLTGAANAQSPTVINFNNQTNQVTAQYSNQTLYDNLSFVGTAGEGRQRIVDPTAGNFAQAVNTDSADNIADGSVVTQMIGEEYIFRQFAQVAVAPYTSGPTNFTPVSYNVDTVSFYVTNQSTDALRVRARVRFYEDNSPNDPINNGGRYPGTLLNSADDYFVDVNLAARSGGVGTYSSQLVTIDLNQTNSGALNIAYNTATYGDLFSRIHAGLVFTNEAATVDGFGQATSGNISQVGQLLAVPGMAGEPSYRDNDALVGSSADFVYFQSATQETPANTNPPDAADGNGARVSNPNVNTFQFSSGQSIRGNFAWAYTGDFTYSYVITPEPGSIGFAAIGFLPVATFVVRRRRASRGAK